MAVRKVAFAPVFTPRGEKLRSGTTYFDEEEAELTSISKRDLVADSDGNSHSCGARVHAHTSLACRTRCVNRARAIPTWFHFTSRESRIHLALRIFTSHRGNTFRDSRREFLPHGETRTKFHSWTKPYAVVSTQRESNLSLFQPIYLAPTRIFVIFKSILISHTTCKLDRIIYFRVT